MSKAAINTGSRQFLELRRAELELRGFQSWIEQAAIDQLHQTAKLEGIDAIVGLPDLHAGRGIAVGAAFWSCM